MQIGERERSGLGELALEAGAKLLVVGRVVAGLQLVDLRRHRTARVAVGTGLGQRSAQAGGAEACWIGDGNLLLAVRTAVVLLQRHQAADVEAVVEESIAAAQNGLRLRAFLVSVKRVGERKARATVVVIGNMILRLEAQAAGQGQELDSPSSRPGSRARHRRRWPRSSDCRWCN